MTRDVWGFLIGMGAGVSLGILLAPRSGEKTRRLLGKKVSVGAGYLRQRGTDAQEAASEVVREGARKIAKGTETVKAAVDAGRQSLSEAIHS